MGDIEKNVKGGLVLETGAEDTTDRLDDRQGIYSDDVSEDLTLVEGTVHDAKDMRRMGKMQELRRNFRTFSAIGFACCVMGTWEILYLQNTPALLNGGKAGMFWSYIWVYVGQTFIVLSLAEMSSMAPTAGGQYHWVSEFAPASAQKILSYTSGWLAMLGWQLFVTADSFLCANLILALAAVNNPDFVVKPYMTTVIVIFLVIVICLVNIFGVRYFPKFGGMFIFLHVFAALAVIGVLWGFATPDTAENALLNIQDLNEPGLNWPNIGLALMVGQVPGLFTVQGSDTVAHLAEEVKDAGLVVPRAILASFFGNIPFSMAILITYIFTLGDTAEATSSPTGFPFIYAFQNCLSTGGVSAMIFIMLLLIFLIDISVVASTSRQTFAFARDNGVPFSSWVSTVNKRRQVPVNSIIVTGGFTAILSLIYIGSVTAFNAFISTPVIALMATYSISIGCVLWKRIRARYFGGPSLPPCRWSLGAWGIPVNVLGLLFCVYSFFWSFWPVSNTTDPALFNWSVVIFEAVVLLACAQYALVARRTYEGPVVKVRQD